MRTIYHEFESLDHLLSSRMLPGGGRQPIRLVVFGGTGAVGGAAILELAKLCLKSRRYRKVPLRAEIHATGSTDKEISKFAGRLYMALESEAEITKVEPRRHYRIGDRVELRFSLLRLALPKDLPEHVAAARAEQGEGFDLEETLGTYFSRQERPFLEFVEGLGSELLHAVIVAIPLPSVATYTLERIDRLVADEGLDRRVEQRIKTRYLRNFVRGLAVIQQRHARYVLIAHTTAVGGMYRVDGGEPEIRLGFAHSASGQKLKEKKFFADDLTVLYLEHGFDVLVTAAAIGIDSVAFHAHLSLGRAERAALAARIRDDRPIPAADLEGEHPNILLYPALCRDFDLESGSVAEPADGSAAGSADEGTAGSAPGAEAEAAAGEGEDLSFGHGKELMVPAAVRSGENGLFSVANCIALYNVMKVAIPEELAMVLVRHAVFGPERRRDWFRDKIAYYGETENSQFALRLLESDPRLVRAHLGTFGVQAYQQLGSSTHQARLHELGLVCLLLRLEDLGARFEAIPEAELLAGLGDLEDFFWRRTRPPAFEGLEALTVEELGRKMGALCEVDSMESAGLLLGYDARQHGLREVGRERFLARLATALRRYLSTITSLGIPILFRSPSSGADRILLGPYVAPIEKAVGSVAEIGAHCAALAEAHDLPFAVARDWVIANNGFVDLRPHALASAAKEPGRGLAEKVSAMASAEEVETWIDGLVAGSYFTTCGLVALRLRLGRLFAQVRGRRIELGTMETWKHLFPRDPEGRHILSPGLVETARFYAEGQGKVTGTESLWPDWGY